MGVVQGVINPHNGLFAEYGILPVMLVNQRRQMFFKRSHVALNFPVVPTIPVPPVVRVSVTFLLVAVLPGHGFYDPVAVMARSIASKGCIFLS